MLVFKCHINDYVPHLVDLALLLHGAPVLVGDPEPLRVPGPDVDVHGAEVVVLLVTRRPGSGNLKIKFIKNMSENTFLYCELLFFLKSRVKQTNKKMKTHKHKEYKHTNIKTKSKQCAKDRVAPDNNLAGYPAK